MRREIRALQQRLDMTMVYVTHDQVEAMTMADQIILMNGGRIEQIGTPDDLYAHPRTPFAARFIGTPPMNIIPASSLANAPHLMPAGASAKALIGIRPEAVRLISAGVPASVVAVEFLGADTLIETRLGDHPFVVRTPGKAAVAKGQTIHVEWLRSDAHWFDTKAQ
jgi:sn-glycerol 3-phosphate transport system ATP-binding protein